MFGKYINLPVFLGSFLVGLVFIFLSSPQNKIVRVYPTPENVDKIEYIDPANNCFSFQAKKLTCPNDATIIKNIPIQNSNNEKESHSLF
jgi:hypothetical protein|tara:strand:- start:27 stop:293 length:267 start_codon:yes stop_codon:yes gene_type:complete